MQNGLAIDLSKFTDIEIDKEAETLTIGPGVHFGDIFDPVFEAGFQISKCLYRKILFAISRNS